MANSHSATPPGSLSERISSLVDCEPEISAHDIAVKALPLLVEANEALATSALWEVAAGLYRDEHDSGSHGPDECAACRAYAAARRAATG